MKLHNVFNHYKIVIKFQTKRKKILKKGRNLLKNRQMSTGK